MNLALRRPQPFWRSPAFAVVAAAHLAGLLALAAWDIGRPESVILQTLEVRLIEEAPKVVEQTPQVVPPKPAPTRPEPPRPILAAAAEAPATPTAMSVPPQPAPAPRAESAPTPAPAAPVVTAARFDAEYLQNPKPVYPPMSRRLNEEGKVLLRVRVGADGGAREVEIRQSSGFPRLDAAARDAVSRWRFVAARRGADAVDSWVTVPIVFSLEQQ